MRPTLVVCALVLLSGACTASDSPTDAGQGRRTPPPADAGIASATEGIRIESVLSVPGGGEGSSWSFPSDQEGFDLRVRLSGRGVVTALLELRAEPSGEVIVSREERIEVDGSTEVAFDDIHLPRRGGYTLDLRISGDGISQRSTVTIERD